MAKIKRIYNGYIQGTWYIYHYLWRNVLVTAVFTSISIHSLMEWYMYMTVFKMKCIILLFPLETSPSYPLPATVTSWAWTDAICDHLLYYSVHC